jgi:release factor glutamine methyltransferase
MTESLRRGEGPWPSTNTELAVSAWLHGRMGQVEDSERPAMVRWMLDHASGQPKGERLVHDFRWSESLLDRLAVWADRLNEGEPLQHVLGEAWFDGLRISVSPVVLIPRPETEELVEALSNRLKSEASQPLHIVDWCTGSGCIALALKRRFPEAAVSAWDLSSDALEVARANALQNHLSVDFDVRDVLSATPEDFGADTVVSNPPYIPHSEAPGMHPRVTRHEPAMALFVPSDDPLCFYRALQRWCEQGGLRAEGWLAMECHTKFASDVAGLLTSSGGWKNVEMLHDLQGLPRHVLAQRALP